MSRRGLTLLEVLLAAALLSVIAAVVARTASMLPTHDAARDAGVGTLEEGSGESELLMTVDAEHAWRLELQDGQLVPVWVSPNEIAEIERADAEAPMGGVG